jgi:hypothetical protein
MGTPVCSTNKTDRHDIAEILLKVALNTIKQATNKTSIGWCLSPLTLFVRIPLERGVLDTTLCDKVCQGQVCGFLRFSSTNKTDRNDIMKYCLNWR